MPFFGSLSDIFASLSPRRRPEDRPSAQRRPPSRTPLASPLRRPVSDRNPFSLGSDSQADHLSPALSTQTLGTSASAFSEPIPAGQVLTLGSFPSQDKSAQMKSKGQPQDDAQARQDEARLFGANYKYVLIRGCSLCHYLKKRLR
ncbi:hypothetical protein NUU61_002019 [Penicillium alfredii]|uniref:Uncharacterized protein n=1 Tax=Penicillium alfredii TaxID=1506179 RepID=A0A9W9KGX0_9EURO|nr:uncharacterized protein NUU61_002019 [Penicillium alfredii]KAJ5104672.1 hypothetical protein NUU61_002019 [Penicillium alfredii]